MEHDFSWIYPRSGKAFRHPAFLCIDYYSYQGIYLGPLTKSPSGYASKRMVPPGQLNYLYVLDDVQNMNLLHEKRVLRDYTTPWLSYSETSCPISLEEVNCVSYPKDENVINKRYEV